ncbi:MAG: hypothetical protein ACRDMH_06990 [Solirubrobacterales bacterium]
MTRLRLAIFNLPPSVAYWLACAMRSRSFRIGAGSYEDPESGTVYPVVAAAKLAGAWVSGELTAGHPDWGAPNEPALEIEDFAGYFDLCAEELGIAEAIDIVRRTLSHPAPADYPIVAAAAA